MKRIHTLNRPFDSIGGSTTDGNRLYSILLDARASTVSENMYDISEKLLSSEKENAKIVLEQLWSLKKNMLQDSNSSTVDMLIQFYQEKMDLLRNKEEHMKKISSDSRTLLEEKRKRDAEIATVKQEIGECSEEIARLNAQLEKLKVKEQELALIESQVNKELSANGNEIINGLYEIILPQKRFGAVSEEKPETDPQNIVKVESQEEIKGDDEAFEEEQKSSNPVGEKDKSDRGEENTTGERQAQKVPEKVPFPKSVVKTTRGNIIAEYFYDPAVEKKHRHYIYNSVFFSEQLQTLICTLQKKYDQNVYSESLQLVQDALKRISEHKSLHFALATNEILNEKTLKEMNHNLRTRAYEDVLAFCNRLKAKITAMGSNYVRLISEQMQRYKS